MTDAATRAPAAGHTAAPASRTSRTGHAATTVPPTRSKPAYGTGDLDNPVVFLSGAGAGWLAVGPLTAARAVAKCMNMRLDDDHSDLAIRE